MKKLLLTKGPYGNRLSEISAAEVKKRLKNKTLIELKNGIYEGTVIEEKVETEKKEAKINKEKPSRAKKEKEAN